jgi:hypothetical protein
VLVLVLVLGMALVLPPVSYAEEEATSELVLPKRDVYVSVDTTNRMAGKPWQDAKAATRKLCWDLLSDTRYDTWIFIGVHHSFAQFFSTPLKTI